MVRDGSLIHRLVRSPRFFLQREDLFAGYVVLAAICVAIQSIAYIWADSTREGGTELVLRPCVVGDEDESCALSTMEDCCTQYGHVVYTSWNDLVLEGETVWSANKQAGLMLLVLSSLSCAMGFCVLCCGSTDPDSVAAGAKRLILENNCALLSCTPGSCYCRTKHNHYWHLGCILPRVPAMIVRTGSTKTLKEKAREMFDEVDDDKSGLLDSGEIIRLAKMLGVDLDLAQVITIIKMITISHQHRHHQQHR